MNTLRIPADEHRAGQWLITELVPDFRLEDVWALPVSGTIEQFADLVAVMTGGEDLIAAMSLPSRVLFAARDLLGRLGLGRTDGPATERLPIPGSDELSLRQRLPPALVGSADTLTFTEVPFVPLYKTDDEFAAELSNRTVHGVLHLAWASAGPGHFVGQLAVYVKPRGRLGAAYMTLIEPFRHLVVYPELLRQIGRAWERRMRHSADANAATAAAITSAVTSRTPSPVGR